MLARGRTGNKGAGALNFPGSPVHGYRPDGVPSLVFIQVNDFPSILAPHWIIAAADAVHRIERPSGEKRAWEIVSPFWETRDLGFFCKPSSRTANNCRIQSAPARTCARPAVRRHIFQTPHSDGGCQLAIRAFPGHGTFHGTLAFPGPGDRIEELRRVRRPKRSRPASTVAAQASTLFQKGAMKIVCTLPWPGYATTTGMMTVVWRTLIDRTGLAENSSTVKASPLSCCSAEHA